MTRSEHVLWLVKKTRPTARFVSQSHSGDFLDPESELGEGFTYVSLYDEKIDSTFLQNKKAGLIIIDNAYLASFAYNLALSWVYAKSSTNAAGLQRVLLKYNFKKFFGEQLLYAHNNSFSRAVFLETLLYEEREMRPVFAAAESVLDFEKTAKLLSGIMSGLVVNHELGHIYLTRFPDWKALFGDNLRYVAPQINAAETQHGLAFATELKCDLIALFSAFQLHKDQKGLIFSLRTIAFGFAVFSIMISLSSSARETVSVHREKPETIDLSSIKKTHIDYDYTIIPAVDMINRARIAVAVCEEISLKESGHTLYGNDTDFPLDADFFDRLLQVPDQIMRNDDPVSREMALLLAQSFHGYPEGINYLYLRSKVYKSERDISN